MIIRKAKKISGMGISLRNATPEDAAFILSLRIDERLNKYISAVSGELSQQVAFLERYAEKSDEAFFIIESSDGEPLGTIRLYDRQGDSFCWGSWIVKPDAPARTGTKSAILVYIYAFEHLGFAASHFDVRQSNVNVWRFHEKTGAQLVRETELDRFYVFPQAQWAVTCQHYQELISDEPIIIEELA
jgi:RimJ/RimL family protein N-acetyltransferase